MVQMTVTQLQSASVHGYTNLDEVRRNTGELYRNGFLFIVSGFYNTGKWQSSRSTEMLEAAVALGAEKSDTGLIKKLRAVIAAEDIVLHDNVEVTVNLYRLDREEIGDAATLLGSFLGTPSSGDIHPLVKRLLLSSYK